MGLFDWIGPTSLTKRRGWDALPAVTEQKSYPYIDDQRAVIISPLIHGPGATGILNAQRGQDANSAVYACLQSIAAAIAEPELKVYHQVKGERVAVDDAPMADLLARPNPYMTLDRLLAYLSHCLHVDGNAYWRKLRAGNELTGNVVQLWPISPCRIEPRTQSGSGDFISFWRYYIRPGRYEDIDPENIVHFPMGVDDKDHRLGCAPLKRLAREVSSDDQATRYADRLLANFAAPGLSVEFDKDAAALTQAQAEEIKARIIAQYSGDSIGAVSVMSPGAKLTSHGFSPEQMDMKTLHRVPEERIAAVLGVPAIVAGLGAGLDRSTYSNFKEAREAFTEMKLVPLWRQVAAEITLQLLPDFDSDRSAVVEFDIDDVRALSDDQNALATRLQVLVAAGILDADEARAELGHDPRPTQPALPAPAQQRSRPRMLSLAAARQTLGREPETFFEAAYGIEDTDEDILLRRSGMPSRLLARKALDDLPGQFDGLKDDGLPAWEAELRTFLTAQLGRVTRALRAGHDTAEGLVAEGEATLLGEVLAPLQTSMLADVQGLVVAELGIAFDLDDAATRAYLQAAGANIVGITDTTRAAVRAELIAGQHAGESIDQLAARLRALSVFNDKRARTIARTELGHASNTAALATYRASGVVAGIRVFDGDYDAECAAMNGRTFSLDQAPSTLQHPNCRRAFAPITDANELTRSA